MTLELRLFAFGILLKHVILCLGEGPGVDEVPQSGLQCADLVQIRHGRNLGLKLNVATVSHGPSQKDAERSENGGDEAKPTDDDIEAVEVQPGPRDTLIGIKSCVSCNVVAPIRLED